MNTLAQGAREPIAWIVQWRTPHTPKTVSAYVKEDDARRAAVNVARYADASDVTVTPAYAALNSQVEQPAPAQCKNMPAGLLALIQQLAWYYQVNDCAERSAEDALEVPIRDLRLAARIARDMALPDAPAHTSDCALHNAPALPVGPCDCGFTAQVECALTWEPEAGPDANCPYDHTSAETPFGAYRIEWKSWKDYPTCTVDFEGQFVTTENEVPDAKAAAQDDFNKRLRACSTVKGER